MDWGCSLMQAGRPYQDRLFGSSQLNCAIACSVPVNSIMRSPVRLGQFHRAIAPS
ncbi:MAG: hypothetical protein RIB93_01205 [Coleofasciculus sp. D1-CHI-01]|uniref:hypothetical protein n=1 Tax=Coleofasciculus sp. D1-CHI-01 TaxID=3068482 RepID=UPI0032FCDF3A